MAFFDDEVMEAAEKLGGDWVKAEEFDGDGLILQAVKVERMKATNPKYGAQEADAIVKREILAEGETFKYYFKTTSGDDRKLDSKSFPLFIAFKEAETEPGDWVKIQRTGKASETRYTVTKVEKPVEPAQQEINPDDIPF